MSTYAAVSKNDDIYKKSTSGGVATTLSTFIIEKGGVVYGAAFDNAFNLLHSRLNFEFGREIVRRFEIEPV